MSEKVEIKAESKIGSLDNAEHKAGGGDKKASKYILRHDAVTS